MVPSMNREWILLRHSMDELTDLGDTLWLGRGNLLHTTLPSSTSSTCALPFFFSFFLSFSPSYLAVVHLVFINLLVTG